MQKLMKLFLIGLWMVLLTLAVSIPSWADNSENGLPTYTASPSATRPRIVTPTLIQTNKVVVCEELRVVSGQDSRAPAVVRLETRVSGGEPKAFRYTFGDGVVLEGGAEIEHRYESGGVMQAMVEVKDEAGLWRTSEGCTTEVRLDISMASTQRLYCSGIQVLSGQDQGAPAKMTFRVTAVDTDLMVDQYRLDFGDGRSVVEQESDMFEYTFANPGTYIVKGAIREKGGFWYDGSKDGCVTEVRVLTKSLEKQPETGAPLWVLGLSGISGLGGVGLWRWRRMIA